MLSYIFRLINQFLNNYRYHLISLSTSAIFLITTIRRYFRLKNEYDHFERRYRMLHSITSQKQDELEKSINHINQLLFIEKKRMISTDNQCVYDHGDHISMPSFFSSDCFLMKDDDESENDPLLQRLKFTKPTRLKSSLKQSSSENNPTIQFTDLNPIHTVYDEYLSEL